MTKELTLQHTTKSQEALHIGGWERIGTPLHGLGSSSRQGLGQELLMGLLIRADLLDIRIGSVLDTGLREVFLGIVLETLFVETGFQVLQGQGIVENVG